MRQGLGTGARAGVTPTDPLTFLAIIVLCTAIAILASIDTDH